MTSREELRRAAAAELTDLLERHAPFSFIRLGDGEVKWLREMQAGEGGSGYRYASEPALSVDLDTLEESDLPLDLRFTRTVINEGRLDGYVVYFRALVDDDLTLSSGPLDCDRAPHWGFRFLRTDRDDFSFGDEIEVRLTVGRWPDLDSWRWSHVKIPRKELAAPFA